MVDLMRGLQLGLTAATGKGKTRGDFRADDLINELQGAPNPLESVQFQDLAAFRPTLANNFSKAQGIKTAAGNTRQTNELVQGLQGAENPMESAQYQKLANLNPTAARHFKAAIGDKTQAGEARAKAYTLDTQKIFLLASAGELDMALKVAKTRKKLIKQLGGDTSDTDEKIRLISSPTKANLKRLSDISNMELQLGVAAGHIPKQQFVAEVDGQIVATDVFGNMSAVDVDGLRQNKKPADPWALVAGQPPEIQKKAMAAFNAAGGGAPGVKALNDAKLIAQEEYRFSDIESILDARFPKATEAERKELDAVISGSKTVESGLKLATETRVQQRTLVKAKGFQKTAVDVLTRILAHPELDDVLGAVEGNFDFRLQDEEAALIADIAEATSILMADNLDIMTGVLSESDMTVIRQLAAGGLDRRRTLKEFRRRASGMKDILSSKIVDTADDKAAVKADTDVKSLSDEDLFTDG